MSVFVKDIKDFTGIDLGPIVQGLGSVIEFAQTILTAFQWGGAKMAVQTLITNLLMLVGVKDKVALEIGSLAGQIVGKLTGMIPGVQGAMQNASDAIGAGIKAAIPVLQSALNTILQIALTAVANLQRFWQQHGDQIIRLFNETWSGVQTVFKTVLPLIVQYVQTVFAGLTATPVMLSPTPWEAEPPTATEPATPMIYGILVSSVPRKRSCATNNLCVAATYIDKRRESGK